MEKTPEENQVIFKILYWGMAGSGKTTALNTLYRFTQENETEILPKSPVKSVSKKDGATLYFDRAIFQSRKNNNILIQIFTVAGQKQFYPLREQVLEGTNGIIYVVDSQKQLLEDNIDALKELKKATKGALIKKIPLIVMLNKKDLKGTIKRNKMIEILKNEGLWYDPPHKLAPWTPIVFETCALYKKRKNTYRSLLECLRRTIFYHLFGEDDEAPTNDDLFRKFFEKKSKKSH